LFVAVTCAVAVAMITCLTTGAAGTLVSALIVVFTPAAASVRFPTRLHFPVPGSVTRLSEVLALVGCVLGRAVTACRDPALELAAELRAVRGLLCGPRARDRRCE
jgi:hypothetical protein